jgi:hypothetical protein
VGSPRFPRQPLYEPALLFDPGRPDAPRPLTTHLMLPSARLTASAPHSVTFRGSITQPVRLRSTLRSSDHSDRTPRKTRFPLAANLGGAGLSPAGLLCCRLGWRVEAGPRQLHTKVSPPSRRCECTHSESSEVDRCCVVGVDRDVCSVAEFPTDVISCATCGGSAPISARRIESASSGWSRR